MFARLISGVRALALSTLGRFPALDARVRLAWRRTGATREGYPDWTAIVAADPANWAKARAEAEDGQKVLIATSIGAHLGAMQLETMLAAAMVLRGAKVDALLCDEILPGCQMCEPRFFPDAEKFARNGPKESHEQLPGVHRPHLSRALRGSLHAQCQRRRGGHQVHRARHHRQGLG
jgi:hypothetical protein